MQSLIGCERLQGSGRQPVGARSSGYRRLIAILQEKRVEVMAKDQAGYFIRELQEFGIRYDR